MRICSGIQESKLQEGQISLELEGYHQYWNYAEKKGYSGTAAFYKRRAAVCSLRNWRGGA